MNTVLLLLVVLFITSLDASFLLRLETVTPEISFMAPNKLRFTVANVGNEAKSFLKWGTPFEEDSYNQMFEVTTLNGDFIPYIGRMARRDFNNMPKEAFIEVKAQDEVSIEFHVFNDFAFPSPAVYNVSLALPDFNNDFENAIIKSQSCQYTVTAALLSIAEKLHNVQFASSFTNCKATEKTTITKAETTSISQSLASYNCMNLNTCPSLVTEWFGKISNTNYHYDQNCFNSIYTNLKAGKANAYCNPAGCPVGVYAYVYPTDSSQTVYYCRQFFITPSEQVNTVIHEISHFNKMCGSQDYAYGKLKCRNLAKSSSKQATHNADNICYFSDDATSFSL